MRSNLINVTAVHLTQLVGVFFFEFNVQKVLIFYGLTLSVTVFSHFLGLLFLRDWFNFGAKNKTDVYNFLAMSLNGTQLENKKTTTLFFKEIPDKQSLFLIFLFITAYSVLYEYSYLIFDNQLNAILFLIMIAPTVISNIIYWLKQDVKKLKMPLELWRLSVEYLYVLAMLSIIFFTELLAVNSNTYVYLLILPMFLIDIGFLQKYKIEKVA